MIIAPHCQPGAHRGDYTPQQAWPDDCYVQWGSSGIVFRSGKGMEHNIETLAEGLTGDQEAAKEAAQLLGKSYTTAFFEAFPTNPKTFIRGEGRTIAEAEAQAFQRLSRHLACPGHEFERRGYTNGAGFCKYCGLFASKVFDPTTLCCQCGTPTNHSTDKDGNFWCESCYPDMPRELWSKIRQRMEQYQKEDEDDCSFS